MAGRFYPSNPETLTRDIEEYVSQEQAGGGAGSQPLTDAIACLVPHAGYMYSGHVAGAVYRRLPPRASYIILAPNHFGRGAPLAIMSQGAWLTPLGAAPISTPLARSLTQACHLLVEDAGAHAGEHSLEVQLPFLQHLIKEFSFVPVSIGASGYAALEALGRGVAETVRHSPEPVMIVASSDLNHYEPDDVTRLKDRKAIDPILALDPRGLYDVIRREDISMCGFGPAVSMLTAAKEIGAQRAELVKYATSADMSGDRNTVVGYAGIVIA